ncbi:MAG: WecB/TagA/CpsF family glycosyltransferase [Halioglobus sp.]
MTALTHDPARDCVSPLGIPVDNLTLEDTVDRIFSMASLRDGTARLVSTLNVDFLVNALGSRFSSARHPELLDVLRHSDLVTADGFPIIWLSRLVGRPLKQRVCGSDLVPALAARAAGEKRSLFLLGGAAGVAQAAAEVLKQRNPGLSIAGTAAPFVHTAGMELAASGSDDEALVKAINESGADILLIGLGNPKQELWFNRNRDSLTVPVSIGVGGSFEFITGTVKRAPEWLQKLNMEWLYRITQDPGRLFSRYAKGLVKLTALSWPLVTSRLKEKLVFAGRTPAGPDAIGWRKVWSAREESLAVLRLPELVGRQYLEALVQQLVEDADDGGLRIIDFGRVRKVEMAAHQALLTLAELQQSSGSALQLMAIPNSVKRDLAATRVLDALHLDDSDTLAALGSSKGSQGGQLFCRSYVLNDCALTFLGGKLSERGLAEQGIIECLQQTSRDRDCIIDLRNVTLLESSAVAVLQPFFADRNVGEGRVVFSGLTDHVQQMIQMVGMGEPDNIVNDSMLLSVVCDGEANHGG